MAVELPVVSCEPVCPAALPIAGTCAADRGVVCRAMQQDIGRDDGTALDMSAGRFGFLQHEATAGVLLTVKSDPGTVSAFCHGDGVPVLTDDDDKRLARASYTRCPVWQARRNADLAGQRQLVVEQEPEPVSMGMEEGSTFDAEDPWARAREDLELLLP